jgi:hypothetical protein
VDVTVSDQLGDRLALDRIVLDDEQLLDAALGELADAIEAGLEPFLADRLLRVGEGARLQAAPLLVHAGDHVDRDVPGRRIVLEPIEQHPPIDVGQPEVERDGIRLDRARELERLRAARRDHALEARLPPHLEQRHRERRVVLDHEQHAIARLEVVVVIRYRARDLRDRRLGGMLDRDGAGDLRRDQLAPCLERGLGGGGDARLLQRAALAALRLVDRRQEQRERAALAGVALDAQVATEEARDLATDREAEPGAAVLAARRAVGLLECLEDQALLVLRDADAGVGHREREDVGSGAVDPEVDPAALRELHRVR